MNTELIVLLESHGVKPTANRLMVAKALTETIQPLSLSELERRIQTIDKSNVFRAFTLFKEHHLVHAIEGSGDGTRYELCHSHSHHEDDDQHVHFYCEKCHRTFCLHETPIPSIDLPDDYVALSVNYMVKGICAACKNKS